MNSLLMSLLKGTCAIFIPTDVEISLDEQTWQ